jgi:hypothetical protein
MPNRTGHASPQVSGVAEYPALTWPPNHGQLPSTTAHCGHSVTKSVTEVMASVHTGGNPAAGEGSSDSGGRASHRWSTLAVRESQVRGLENVSMATPARLC